MRIPPVIQFIAAASVAWVVSTTMPVLMFSGMAVNVAASAFSLVGVVFLVSSVRLFSQRDTTINPLDPSKAEHLVVDGLYKVTRNPMYVGLALLLVGWCLYLGTLSAFASVAVFVFAMNELQIKPEERALTDKFGEQYQAYIRRVRRWV